MSSSEELSPILTAMTDRCFCPHPCQMVPCLSVDENGFEIIDEDLPSTDNEEEGEIMDEDLQSTDDEEEEIHHEVMIEEVTEELPENVYLGGRPRVRAPPLIEVMQDLLFHEEYITPPNSP